MNRTLILLLVILLTIPTLFAQKEEESQHVDFTKQLMGFDDKPLADAPQKPGDKPTPITLSDTAVTALEMNLPDDKGMSAEDHFKLDLLARKIYKQKDCVLTHVEIAQIEERIGKVQWPSNAILGAAWRILDPARVAKLEKQ